MKPNEEQTQLPDAKLERSNAGTREHAGQIDLYGKSVLLCGSSKKSPSKETQLELEKRGAIVKKKPVWGIDYFVVLNTHSNDAYDAEHKFNLSALDESWLDEALQAPLLSENDILLSHDVANSNLKSAAKKKNDELKVVRELRHVAVPDPYEIEGISLRLFLKSEPNMERAFEECLTFTLSNFKNGVDGGGHRTRPMHRGYEALFYALMALLLVDDKPESSKIFFHEAKRLILREKNKQVKWDANALCTRYEAKLNGSHQNAEE